MSEERVSAGIDMATIEARLQRAIDIDTPDAVIESWHDVPALLAELRRLRDPPPGLTDANVAPDVPRIHGEVWRGDGYDGPAAVALVDGSPVAYWLAPDGWHAASGAREVFALRGAIAAVCEARRRAERMAEDAVRRVETAEVRAADYLIGQVDAERERAERAERERDAAREALRGMTQTAGEARAEVERMRAVADAADDALRRVRALATGRLVRETVWHTRRRYSDGSLRLLALEQAESRQEIERLATERHASRSEVGIVRVVRIRRAR